MTRNIHGFCNAAALFRLSIVILIGLLVVACSKEAAPAQKAVEVAATPAAKQQSNAGFDGERAYAHVKNQVEFGPRPGGSPALEKTRQYIISELNSFGLKPVVDSFTPATPRGKVKMANIIAELPGDSKEIIMIGSHYDTKYFKEFSFLGANDGASSTGALLELARTLGAEKSAGRLKNRYTYQFVFFDGEEAFCAEWSQCLNGKDNTYGSRHLVERLRKEKRLDEVKALILLDMVGDKELAIARDRNSSGWLIDAIWSAARELGYEENFPPRDHYITDDHIHFLEAGVPAVDLIDFEYDDEENAYWHTKEDTLDKISARSLKIVGDVVIASLPKIEAQIR